MILINKLKYLFFIFILLYCITNLFSDDIIEYEQDNLLLDSVKISGENRYFSDNRLNFDLLNKIHMKIRSSQTLVSKENITRIIDEILDYYTNNGFPFCEIKVLGININTINNRKLILNLEINSKKYAQIKFINFTGNKSSTNEVLLRETRLENLPFRFNPTKLNDAKKYLYKTMLFSFIPKFYLISAMNESNYGVLFSLEEEKYNSIDAIFGYSTEKKSSNDNDSKFLGKIDLSFNNLFGTFRKARLSWYRGVSNEESIELFYEEPWLLNIPLKSGIGFNQDYYNSLYLERSYSLNLDYNLNLNFNLISDFKLKNIYPDSAMVVSNLENNLGEIRKETYLGGFKYISSYFNQYHLNQESGISLEIIGGTIKNTINKTIIYDTNIKIDMSLSYNIFSDKKSKKENSLNDVIFFTNRFFYEHIFTENDSLSIYDKLKIGGINSVRGYKDDQFNTISKMFTNNELIFKLDDDTKLFLLYDIGLWTEENKISDIYEDYNLISGLGIGINYLHRLGEMEVSYAYPIEEGFESGKIHVRYINKF